MSKYLVQRIVKRSNIPGINWWDSYSTEFLKLRLVSKRWKHAVEWSLENHVDRNPQQSTDEDYKTAISVPRDSFNYGRVENFRFGANVFECVEQVDKFLQQMKGHKGNPFPGKSIYLQPTYFSYTLCNDLVKKCVELFVEFGKHVLSHEIQFCMEECRCHLDLCKNILKYLSHGPNLKSLTLTGNFDFHAKRKEFYYFGVRDGVKYFPDLPHLETFDWRIRFYHCARSTAGFGSQWVNHMFDKYGRARRSRLQKLGTDQHSICFPNLAPNLTGLTELHLQLDSSEYWETSDVSAILQNLSNSRQLQSFRLNSTRYFRKVFNITELISELASFPIRNVILEDVKLKEEPITRHLQASMNITSLHLYDNLELTYEFLWLLPNLQVLHIYFDEDTTAEASKDLKPKPKSTHAGSGKIKIN